MNGASWLCDDVPMEASRVLLWKQRSEELSHNVASHVGADRLSSAAIECQQYRGYLAGLGSHNWINTETLSTTTTTQLSDNNCQKTRGNEILFYPFGGVDVIHPLWLFGHVKHVVFSSAEIFGASEDSVVRDLNTLCESGSKYLQLGMGATMFDSFADLQQLQDTYGMSGVGAMALIRLVIVGNQQIMNVLLFSFRENGAIAFKRPGEGIFCPHALVITQDAGSSEPTTPRYMWFLYHNIHIPDPTIDAVFSSLNPSIVLFKSAPETLFNTANSETLNRRVYTPLRKGFVCVTDSSQGFSTMFPDHLQPFVTSTSSIHSIDFHAMTGHKFGYGDIIFWFPVH
ncbi:hypothetical protein Pelo_6879 [Pelomyxa schiedti]|nr:hypothetical protein Pelo_6879 [Pelomyxa schiedti]